MYLVGGRVRLGSGGIRFSLSFSGVCCNIVLMMERIKENAVKSEEVPVEEKRFIIRLSWVVIAVLVYILGSLAYYLLSN